MKKALVFTITLLCIGLTYQFPHAMLNPGELIKGHQKLNNKCLSCHNPFWGISNDKCISCHKLSEIGKDTLNESDTKILFHQNFSKQKCTSCHTDHMGIKPDNALSDFKHEFLSETMISNCGGCHSKPSDKLHKSLSTKCNSCHTTTGWKSSVVFNHDMIQGADKNKCSGCHQKPKDSYHSLISTNCDKCHSTTKWIPSTFDHSAYFQLDQNHNAKCIICHTNNNFKTFTCYGCHEHSQGEIIQEHNEEGISNINNCISCHRSGNEHDIRMNGNEANNVKDFIKSQENNEKKKHDKKKESDDD